MHRRVHSVHQSGRIPYDEKKNPPTPPFVKGGLRRLGKKCLGSHCVPTRSHAPRGNALPVNIYELS